MKTEMLNVSIRIGGQPFGCGREKKKVMVVRGDDSTECVQVAALVERDHRGWHILPIDIATYAGGEVADYNPSPSWADGVWSTRKDAVSVVMAEAERSFAEFCEAMYEGKIG